MVYDRMEEWMDEIIDPIVPSFRETPTRWDPDLVAARLVQAFVTLDLLDKVPGPRQPGGHWPLTTTEWADQLAQAELEESERRTRQQDANRIRIRPSATEITQMEVAFAWITVLRVEDAAMALIVTLWSMRTARGQSIKRLIAEKHWAPATFFRKRAKALVFLAEALNARGVPIV